MGVLCLLQWIFLTQESKWGLLHCRQILYQLSYQGDELFLKSNICHSLKYSVQFSLPVMSNSLWPHRLQHTRPPCPSPTPRIYSNSGPLSQWCHPTISCSVLPFFCLQSFPASWYFQMSQFFVSGGQSTGVAASASVLPVSIQDWSPLGWTGWISLLSLLKSLLQHHSSKASIL